MDETRKESEATQRLLDEELRREASEPLGKKLDEQVVRRWPWAWWVLGGCGFLILSGGIVRWCNL